MPERRRRATHERSLIRLLGRPAPSIPAERGPARRRGFLMRCIVASALLGGGMQGLSRAPARGAEPANGPELQIPIRRTRLDNGLRVVLSRDTSRPTVAICLTYAAGAAVEAAGQRGVSSLLERMLSRHEHGPGELDAIAGSGGQSGSFSAADRAEFYSLLPSNALAVGLSTAAERMLRPEPSVESFEAARSALLGELRTKSFARPYAGGYRALRSLVFSTEPALARTAEETDVGDLAALSLERAVGFLHAHYAPNNAVLAVSGNFEMVDALKLIRQHFGPARRAETPENAALTPPEQNAPRRSSVRDVLARTTATFSGWAIPALPASEHPALELAAIILGRGESSRLHQLLVRQESLARDVQAWTAHERGIDLFALRVILDEGSDPEHVGRLWSGQLGALGRWGPTTFELERAKSQRRAAFLRDLDGNLARSRQLASFELISGDAEQLTRELDRYMAVTPEDVQRSVARYLTPARESRILITPGERPRAPSARTSTSGRSAVWALEQPVTGAP